MKVQLAAFNKNEILLVLNDVFNYYIIKIILIIKTIFYVERTGVWDAHLHPVTPEVQESVSDPHPQVRSLV